MISAEKLFAPQSGEQATLDRPLEHLQACHRRIEDRLAVLRRAGDALPKQRAEALAAISNAIRFFSTNGAWHNTDEEESLFPRLHGRVSPQVESLIHRLSNDHSEAAGLHARIEELWARLSTDDATPAGLEEYRTAAARLSELYRQHIELEDTRLTEAAREALTPDELAAIAAEMKRRRGLPA